MLSMGGSKACILWVTLAIVLLSAHRASAGHYNYFTTGDPVPEVKEGYVQVADKHSVATNDVSDGPSKKREVRSESALSVTNVGRRVVTSNDLRRMEARETKHLRRLQRKLKLLRVLIDHHSDRLVFVRRALQGKKHASRAH